MKKLLFVINQFCFIIRYKVLFRGKTMSGNNSACTMLLQEFDPEKQSFKLGNTKVVTKKNEF